MIHPGSLAPEFALSDQDGAVFRLAGARGRTNVLLLFLPAAFTPICSTELPALAALAPRFRAEARTEPVAITVDNTHANATWARAVGASGVRVLSDFWPHGAVARAYGCLANDGVAERCTVIVDRAGVVRFAEVAGRFGKRSIPALLDAATRIDGGVPVTTGSVLPRLDLPVLYATSTCDACASLRAWIRHAGLGWRVVVREVDRDPAALRELLMRRPDGDVPLLDWNGQMTAGPLAIASTLARSFGVTGAPA